MQENNRNSTTGTHQDRHAVSHDDLLNLKIALETCQDVMEFVEDTHIFRES